MAALLLALRCGHAALALLRPLQCAHIVLRSRLWRPLNCRSMTSSERIGKVADPSVAATLISCAETSVPTFVVAAKRQCVQGAGEAGI